MPRDGLRAAQYFGNALSVLERYFLTVPMLEEWQAYSKERPGLSHVVTRAKKKLYRRKGAPDPLAKVKDRHSQERILKALQATVRRML